jgi:hypothetical protein
VSRCTQSGSDRKQPLNLSPRYVLGEGQTVNDVLRINAELLASEGLDPKWPGFEDRADSESD